jgi:D-amino-acid oxidase
MDRRLFLQRAAAFASCNAVGLTGCAKKPIAASIAGTPPLPFYDALGPIIPIRAEDHYELYDRDPATPRPHPRSSNTHDFAHYEDRIADLTPQSHDIPAGAHPFPTQYVRRDTTLTFNVADYSRQLMNDFLIAGGAIETREFQSPQDLASLAEPVIISCTGYGARQLWSDESVVPVRGQIAWLIPQEGVHYGLYYKGVNVLGRRDGIVVQPNHGGEEEGWNDTNEQPDRAAAIAGVEVLQELYSRMAKMPKRGV